MTERAASIVSETEAVDPQRSFAVDGAAGSGKTELCLRRYIVLLAQAGQPEEVLLLVDGDNRAQRLIERVTAMLAGTGEDDPEPARALREQDAQSGWGLLMQPQRLQIHTLASLAHAIVAAAPVSSGCGAGVRLTDDPASYYRIAARSLLRTLDHDERVAPNLETLLLHLDNDLLSAEHLLAGLLCQRVELQRCLDLSRPDTNRDALHAVLADAIGMKLTDVAAAVPEDCVAELAALAGAAARELSRQRSDSPVSACRDLQGLPAGDAAQLDAWLGLRGLLLRDDGTLRREYDESHGFATPPMQQRMRALATRLAEAPGFAGRLASVSDLSAVHYTHLEWTVLQSLLAVLPRAIEDLSRVFRALGEMDLTELLRGANRALQAGPPGIFGAQGLQHLIIDDFHELPFAGADMVDALLASWHNDDARSVLITGNPFASVGRDAGAQPALYLAAGRTGIGGRQLERLRLSTARRSSRRILEWLDSVFATGAASGGEGAMPFWPATSAAGDDSEEGEVIVAAVAGDLAAEAGYVAELLEQRPELRAGSLAVLMASADGAGAMIDGLRARGIACSSECIDRLGQRPVVRDLHALTRALLHLGDRVAWLSLLRAPWCGLTLADLHQLVADSPDVTVWELIIDERRRARLSEDGQQRISRIKRVVAQTLAERGRRDLRRLVEGVWTALGGAVCIRDEHELRHARSYFQLLAELDDGGEPDSLEELHAATGRLLEARPARRGDVLVTTIRQARRRVYDTVVLAGLSLPVPRAERNDALRWFVRAGPLGNAQLLLAPETPETRDGGIGRWLDQLQSLHHDHELQRLVYVGASRARERLVVVTTPPREDSGWGVPPEHSPLRTVWPRLAASLPDTPSFVARAEREPNGRIRRLPSSWLLPEAPQPKVWNVSRQKTIAADEHLSHLDDDARIVARVLTRTLAEVARDGPADWAMRSLDGLENHLQRLFAMLGVSAASVSVQADRAGAAIRRLLEDQRARWILDGHHRKAFAPMAVTGWLDDQLTAVTIDRSFIDEQGTRWLIEYQYPELAGAVDDQGAYDDCLAAARPRLQRHARLVRRLEASAIRTGVLFPLAAEWRESDASD